VAVACIDFSCKQRLSSFAVCCDNEPVLTNLFNNPAITTTTGICNDCWKLPWWSFSYPSLFGSLIFSFSSLSFSSFPFSFFSLSPLLDTNFFPFLLFRCIKTRRVATGKTCLMGLQWQRLIDRPLTAFKNFVAVIIITHVLISADVVNQFTSRPSYGWVCYGARTSTMQNKKNFAVVLHLCGAVQYYECFCYFCKSRLRLRINRLKCKKKIRALQQYIAPMQT